MRNNTDPAATAARLRDELSSIAGRMSVVAADVADLTETLTRSAAAGSAAAVPGSVVGPPQPPVSSQPPVSPQPPVATHPQAPPQPPVPQLQYVTAPFGSYPPVPPGPQPQYGQPPVGRHPFGARYPVGRYPVQPRPAPPSRSLGERLTDATERGLVGRVLAAVGVGVTLVGVVLLLVLAAQAGLLRPELRVTGGAVFAAALVGVGCWIGHNPGKRSGAAALVATGVAAALFDVLAATAIYHWLPEIAGLLIGGAVGAGGMVVAQRWNSQALGLMVSVPLLVFAPVVAGGVDALLVCFLIAYAAATLWLQIGRDWTALFVVNTVASTLPLMVFPITADASSAWFVGVAVLVNLTLALASAILLAPGSSRAVLLGLIAVLAGAPVLMIGNGLTNQATAVAVISLGAALFAAAALGTGGHARIPGACRVVWLGAGAVFVSLALGVALTASILPLGFLAAAVVVILAARWSAELEPAVRVIATAFASLGLAMLLAVGGGTQLLEPWALGADRQATLLIGALLGIAVTTLLARDWAVRKVTDAHAVWLVGGLVNLWLITEICLSVGALVTGGTDAGFRGSHLAATLLWFGSAAAALLWARTLRGSGRSLALATGLSVIAAAVAKLFVFDLAALDGLFRVIAFIVAGLVLLSLGVAYAQSLTTQDRAAAVPETDPAAR